MFIDGSPAGSLFFPFVCLSSLSLVLSLMPSILWGLFKANIWEAMGLVEGKSVPGRENGELTPSAGTSGSWPKSPSWLAALDERITFALETVPAGTGLIHLWLELRVSKAWRKLTPLVSNADGWRWPLGQGSGLCGFGCVLWDRGKLNNQRPPGDLDTASS